MDREHILFLLNAGQITLAELEDDVILDDEMIKCALKKDGLNYKYLSEEQKSNKVYAILAFQQNRWAYIDFPQQFLEDTFFIQELLVSKTPNLFYKLPDSIKENEGLVKKALETDPFNFVYLPKRLKEKTNLI